MMRITTNGVLRNYKSSLLRSSNTLNFARDKVLTQRNFNSFAEDPASATEAFKLRRTFSRTNDQISNSTTLISKFQSAYSAIDAVKGLMEEASKDASLRAITDSAGAGRQPLGKVLSSTAESIVQTLNVQYSESYIFGGNNAANPPFSWSDAGELLYQGISVDSGGVGVRPEGTPPNPSETVNSTWEQYYNDNPDFKKLVQMSYQTAYVDVGAGLSEDNGELNSASAFNSAISGIDFLGSGLDEDGDPQNAVSQIKLLSEIFARCDADSGDYASDQDEKDAERLVGKLEHSLAELTNKWSSLDGKSQYLTTNKERLIDTADTLNEQILSLEQADLADAITDFSWAQYCYNSALKVGNSILSQSLIDYMN